MSAISLLARAAISITLLHFTPHAEATEAQPTCAARAQVIERLSAQFGETPRGIGLRQNDGLVEVFASEKTGSWTILMTRPDGQTCLVAAGQHWEDDAAHRAKPGKDA